MKDFHLVFRESAGLVSTDDRGRSHCFACVQLPDKILLLEHLLHAQRKTDGNAHRKSFRNSHHNQGHSYHYRTQHVFQNLDYVSVVVNVPVQEEIIEKSPHYYKAGNDVAHLGNHIAQIVKLLRKGSGDFLFFLNQFCALSFLRVGSDSSHATNTQPLDNRGTAQDYVRRESSILFAFRYSYIFVSIELTGEYGFVHLQGSSFEDNGIRRHLISAFELDNIPDADIAFAYFVELCLSAVAGLADYLDRSFILDLVQHFKLFLSAYLKYETDTCSKQNRHKYSGRFYQG